MAVVTSCIRGRFGSTPYYQTKMKASEIVSKARPASETERWADWGIQERMQRELNERRVEGEIIPYLARSPDRFFGAVLVLIYRGDVEFEPLEELNVQVPAAYRSAARDIGFLTVDGGELIVLDGQHRLAGLRGIIQKSTKVEGDCKPDVPNDEVSVVFVEHESTEKTRRIFNKVNRNAKPTTRSDNIITSEDDGFAIVTRRLLDEGAPLDQKKKLVNWRQNTLSKGSTQITTLSALYESVQDVLSTVRNDDGSTRFAAFDEKKAITRPTDELLTEGYDFCERWWELVLKSFDVFRKAQQDSSSVPAMREPSEPYSLLLKPAGTIVLFRGLSRAVQRGLELEKAVRRARKIDWSLDSDLWRDVLIRPDGRIMARKQTYELAADLIAYLIAPEKTEEQHRRDLQKRLNAARGLDLKDEGVDWNDLEELPKPVVDLSPA